MKKWSVSFVFHDKDGDFFCHTIVRAADTIVGAIKKVDSFLDSMRTNYNWHDYTITGAHYVPELPLQEELK